MTEIDFRRYAMLMRVLDFGNTTRELFPASTVAGQALAAVAAAADRLSSYEVTRTARRRPRAKTEAKRAHVRRRR